MPKIWHGFAQMYTRIIFYDRVKHFLMPYHSSKYLGFDYYWRAATSAVVCAAVTLGLTYPLDLIHTRTSADMARKGTTRLYKTTFDCFNRTNIDEMRMGLYKGWEFTLGSALARAALQLPIYSLVKKLEGGDDSVVGRFQQRIGSAMISGSMITLLLYPLDTCKKINQVNGGRGFNNSYTGFMDVARKAPSQLGMAGLYRGASLMLVTSVVSAFTQFTVYDLLTAKNKKQD